MDIFKTHRRALGRAVTLVLAATALAACADQQSGPAPVFMKGSAAALPAPMASPYAAAPRPAPSGRTVTVKPGQTLNGVARDYHVRPSMIVAANDLKPPYELKAGSRLMIPEHSEAPPAHSAVAAAAPTPIPSSVPPPTPMPPAHAANLMPAHSAAPAPAKPVEPLPTAKADADVIPLDTPPPKQLQAAAGMPPQPVAPATAPGAPPVVAPRNPAAALPLPGEPAVDWNSADAVQGMTGGRFPWPVRGRVLSSYGSGTGGSRNDGINIAAPRGTPVRAIDGGTVAYVGNQVKGYGNLLLVRHANGWISAYAHLEDLDVKLGDKIAPGQVIAKVGETGGVGQPQLHFELRRGKKPVDPREFLAPASSAGTPTGDKAG
jgi:murein DD-endopeptidase MepM/ murein hydrolase activator NlpD